MTPRRYGRTHAGHGCEEAVEGALASVVAALPGGGEGRPGQVEMAEAVAAAVAGERHLVVQAGTGTGKTLAYLVPAILSGRRVVVATATKALQDQLAGKDLPFLAAPPRCCRSSAAVLKGRSNYLCRQRLHEHAGGERRSARAGRGAAAVHAEPRCSGWRRWADTSAHRRPGRARLGPVGAGVAGGERHRRRVPRRDALPDRASRASPRTARAGRPPPTSWWSTPTSTACTSPAAAPSCPSTTWSCSTRPTSSRTSSPPPPASTIGAGRFTALARIIGAVVADEALTAAARRRRRRRSAGALGAHLGRRLRTVPDDVADAVVAGAGTRRRGCSPPCAASTDRGRRRQTSASSGPRRRPARSPTTSTPPSLSPTTTWPGSSGPADDPGSRWRPIDVGPVLAEQRVDPSHGGAHQRHHPADAARRGVGLPGGTLRRARRGQPVRLRGPRPPVLRRPPARSPPAGVRGGHATRSSAALIEAAGGRTLALFTSWRAMNAAVDALRPRLPYRSSRQGDLPKPALLEAFADDEATPACSPPSGCSGRASTSPAPTLCLVTIDRLPFPRPDDPLLQARRERAGRRRSARSTSPGPPRCWPRRPAASSARPTDRGVVAVLDPRLAKAGYRWDVVRALPPMRRTRHREEAEAFLAERVSRVRNCRRSAAACRASTDCSSEARARRGEAESALQSVADAPHRHDELGVVGVVLDLDPEPADVGVDEPAVAEVVVAPHPLEELVAAEHHARRGRRTRTAGGTRSW